MRDKETGNVYWANSYYIDKSDLKSRRRYAIVRDNGKNISVAKIRGFNNNKKNDDRLFELDIKKYPQLTKKCGIDRKVYSRRSDNLTLLEIEDKQVFDKKPDFKLSSHDTHKAINHTILSRKQKKGRR